MPKYHPARKISNSADPETCGVQRMWPDGPLREFSETRPNSRWKTHSSRFLRGYAGSYVCDGCLSPTQGVYRVVSLGKWLCGPCKEKIKSQKSTLVPERRNFAETGTFRQEAQ